jgi:hypothetical protein
MTALAQCGRFNCSKYAYRNVPACFGQIGNQPVIIFIALRNRARGGYLF